MAKYKLNVKDLAAAAAFVIVLGISSILGMNQREHEAIEQSASVREEQDNAGGKENSVTAARAGLGKDLETGGEIIQETGGEISRETTPDSKVRVPVLNPQQAALAERIMEALKQENLEQAAKIMGQEEETLQDMFYSTMSGMRYFYDGKSLTQEIDGLGMVFTKAGTVYYGSFRDGKPEGRCTALQAVNLEGPRYDYSQGIWKNGQMEGPGRTGYCYYGSGPEGEVRDICKKGTFSGDFMDGEVVYTSMNRENETAVWKLTVDHGIVVLDDRWQYGESTGEYQLLSEDDDNHAYVAGEGQITLPVWKNLLVWEE